MRPVLSLSVPTFTGAKGGLFFFLKKKEERRWRDENILWKHRGQFNAGHQKPKHHSDSAFGSPGVSDNAAQVGLSVDFIRRLVKAPLPVDVIFNFNGAEEVISSGAHSLGVPPTPLKL